MLYLLLSKNVFTLWWKLCWVSVSATLCWNLRFSIAGKMFKRFQDSPQMVEMREKKGELEERRNRLSNQIKSLERKLKSKTKDVSQRYVIDFFGVLHTLFCILLALLRPFMASILTLLVNWAQSWRYNGRCFRCARWNLTTLCWSSRWPKRRRIIT